MDVTPEQREESRRRLGIPADWVWGPCSGVDCSEFVWHSGDEQQAAADLGIPFVLACSAACAVTLTP